MCIYFTHPNGVFVSYGMSASRKPSRRNNYAYGATLLFERKFDSFSFGETGKISGKYKTGSKLFPKGVHAGTTRNSKRIVLYFYKSANSLSVHEVFIRDSVISRNKCS